MKKSYGKGWTIIAVTTAALLAVVFIAMARLRTPVLVGATQEQARACLQAEEQRRLPPYGRTCSALDPTKKQWIVGTEFYLRQEHVFAVRRVALTFSTNGTVTDISSRWEWRWSL